MTILLDIAVRFSINFIDYFEGRLQCTIMYLVEILTKIFVFQGNSAMAWHGVAWPGLLLLLYTFCFSGTMAKSLGECIYFSIFTS